MDRKETVFDGVEATERGTRAAERIKERFNITALPQALEVFAGAENGIHDLYMNLNRQLAGGKLEEKTKLLVAAGVAAAAGSGPAVALFTEAAVAAGWHREEVLEGISVASTCSIFNGYYRFRHQVPADARATYEAFRAPFNANSFVKSRLSTAGVEAICVAVSSLNNCSICVEGHINKAKSLGVTDEQIDELIRTAAVAAAAANILGALGNATLPQAVASGVTAE